MDTLFTEMEQEAKRKAAPLAVRVLLTIFWVSKRRLAQAVGCMRPSLPIVFLPLFCMDLREQAKQALLILLLKVQKLNLWKCLPSGGQYLIYDAK